MAISITQEPQVFQPACNPFVWVFESDQTTQPNFSFIVELYVDFVLVSTHQVFNESGNYAKFDASGELRALLTSEMVTTGALLTFYDPAISFVNIKIYEKYGTPPVLQPGGINGNVSRAWNASLRHPDFISFDYNDYAISRLNPNSGNVLFLTDFPRTRKYFVGLYESAFLTFLNRGGSANTDIELKLYDITNTLIASDTVVVTLALNIGVIDCAPQNLITNTSVTLLDFQSCAYYTVRAKAGPELFGIYSGYSELFTFWIDTECHRYDTHRLHWLNKLGGWDSFTFTLVSTNSTKVLTSDYQRERGQWDTSGTAWEYTRYHGEQMAFNKYATDTTVLNSDYIHESVQQWLVRDLYESPKVYLEVTPGAFEPVKVTNEDFTLKQRRVDGLIREVVNMERTYTYNSQLT
jgi:hypothetical protein